MIETLIPEQAVERIRDQIANVLKCEFENQANKLRNEHCNGVKFFAERRVPIAASEKAIVVISTWKGKYGNKNSDYAEGTYSFVLDVVANCSSKGNQAGDTLANFRVVKMYGIVRYILEHSNYETLGFERPFILHTELSEFQVLKFEEDGRSESGGVAQAQAVFVVRCGESTQPNAGKLAAGNDTEVKLEETELGYEYVYNTTV
jgi:hypothetical protein